MCEYCLFENVPQICCTAKPIKRAQTEQMVCSNYNVVILMWLGLFARCVMAETVNSECRDRFMLWCSTKALILSLAARKRPLLSGMCESAGSASHHLPSLARARSVRVIVCNRATITAHSAHWRTVLSHTHTHTGFLARGVCGHAECLCLVCFSQAFTVKCDSMHRCRA